MSGVDLDHPEVIFVKRLNGTGYGFFYSTPAQFQDAANGFIYPIKERIKEESNDNANLQEKTNELCLKASISSMQKVFSPDWNDQEGIDGTRCVAASCAAEIDWEDAVPQCIIIEEVGDEMIVREAFEFLDHPGYPLAVIIGSKGDGGGPCMFFDSIDEFKQIASKAPSQNVWLPQLIYRLYKKTPSIMTGIPTAPQEKGRGVGVECHAYNLNRKGQLIERALT